MNAADLPSDVLSYIFKFVNVPDDIPAVARTCSSWNEAAQSSLLWSQLCVREGYTDTTEDPDVENWMEKFREGWLDKYKWEEGWDCAASYQNVWDIENNGRVLRKTKVDNIMKVMRVGTPFTEVARYDIKITITENAGGDVDIAIAKPEYPFSMCWFRSDATKAWFIQNSVAGGLDAGSHVRIQLDLTDKSVVFYVNGIERHRATDQEHLTPPLYFAVAARPIPTTFVIDSIRKVRQFV